MLQIMRNIHIFVRLHRYNLNQQLFVETDSDAKVSCLPPPLPPNRPPERPPPSLTQYLSTIPPFHSSQSSTSRPSASGTSPRPSARTASAS